MIANFKQIEGQKSIGAISVTRVLSKNKIVTNMNLSQNIEKFESKTSEPPCSPHHNLEPAMLGPEERYNPTLIDYGSRFQNLNQNIVY